MKICSERTRKYCSVIAFLKNEGSYTCRTILLSMEMPPEQALGQLTVFPGNCNHALFMLCLSQQGACFPVLLIIQPRVLKKTQWVNGEGWCLWASDRNWYLARRWSLPSFQKGNNSFFFFFSKLNDTEAHLSGKRICKPEALFANKPPSVLHPPLISPCSRSRAR